MDNSEYDDILDESIGEVEHPVKLRVKSPTSRPEGRAPTMTIEAVRIGRPLKVFALLASTLSLLMFIIGTISTSWVFVDGLRIGMLQQCDVDQRMNEAACSWDFQRTWEQWTCLVLDGLAIFLTFLGVILMIGAMLTLVVRHKYKLYKAVLTFNMMAWIFMLIAVILFPVSFYYRTQMNGPQASPIRNGTSSITVGWSYVVCTCGLLPLLVAFVCLAKDRKSEEIFYQETIFQDSTAVEGNDE